MEQEFKQFRDTNIEVSSCGVIREMGSKKALISHLYDRGYYLVNFKYKAKYRNFYVHRLVAECWCANPNNLPQVDHIDNDKLNNDYHNLRWVDQRTNLNNRPNWCKKINMYDKETGEFIKDFPTAERTAEYLLNIGATNNKYSAQVAICQVCSKLRKSAYGYKFTYKDFSEKAKEDFIEECEKNKTLAQNISEIKCKAVKL